MLKLFMKFENPDGTFAHKMTENIPEETATRLMNEAGRPWKYITEAEYNVLHKEFLKLINDGSEG